MSETIPNTKVYFDVTIGNEPAGRIIISLFTSAAPRACEYFRTLCTGENIKGENGQPLHYKGAAFHRVIPDLICEGGAITKGTTYGTEGESSYGHDTFLMNHSFPGLVSMANMSPVANDSSFIICMSRGSPCKNVERCLGIGRVIEGLYVLGAMQTVGSINGMTEKAIIIKDCGQLQGDTEYLPSISLSGSYGNWSIEDLGVDASGSPTGNGSEYGTSTTLSRSSGIWSMEDFGSDVEGSQSSNIPGTPTGNGREYVPSISWSGSSGKWSIEDSGSEVEGSQSSNVP